MRGESLVIAALLVATAGADEKPGATPPPPSDGGPAPVAVNTQRSLAAVVGGWFGDEAWEYPDGLLPADLPGLTVVGGPAGAGSAKAGWRKPTVYADKSAGVSVSVNCFRWRPAPPPPGPGGTPFARLTEPAFEYHAAGFHDLKAATAGEGGRDVFAFRDGDILFKIEATGADAAARQKGTRTAAEAIWRSRHAR